MHEVHFPSKHPANSWLPSAWLKASVSLIRGRSQMKDVWSEIRLSPLNVHSYINIDKILFFLFERAK